MTAEFIRALQEGDLYYIDGREVSQQSFEMAIYASDQIDHADPGWRVLKPYKQQMQHQERMRNWNLAMAGGYDPYNNHPAVA